MKMDTKLIENLQAERSVLVRRVAKIDDLLSEYGIKSEAIKVIKVPAKVEKQTAADLLKGVNLDGLELQTIPKKVLYALRHIERGTSSQVADRLIKIIPTYKVGRAYQDCRHWLSRFNVDGLIDSEAIGNKNVYIWKK